MKLLALVAVFCLPIYLFAEPSVPEIKFHAKTDFFNLPPDVYFGEAAGVAVNSKGHVFVFSRGGTTGPAYGAAAAQLFEFDADGKFVREIGHNLYAWSFGLPSRSARKTTYGSPTRGRIWSSNSARKAGC